MTTSIIIPCRTAKNTVTAAVKAAREQTQTPLEVIVVDDASTDESGAIAERAGARVIRNDTRRNAGGARNAGMAVAKGDLIAFLDADAVPSKDWLERARQIFDGDATIAAVGGR
ncbi:MAG TPA: glycosyltransferase family 2 protein, partial [Thermoanaerobaculia bacterium]|nr:glycosyltransferase family 2 protein [Thermoanaerobaculia bacterium]